MSTLPSDAAIVILDEHNALIASREAGEKFLQSIGWQGSRGGLRWWLPLNERRSSGRPEVLGREAA